MDEKDLNQGNGEQRGFDESVRPFLEDKEPRRKKTRSGRFVLGILLIVAGCLMGLCYLGNICFVSTSTSTVVIESVPVPTAVAVQESHVETIYSVAVAVAERSEGLIVERANGNEREILAGNISAVNATVGSVDISLEFIKSGENKLVILNDDSNKVNVTFSNGILSINDNAKSAKAKVKLTLSHVEGITVNSTSGDLNIFGTNDEKMEYLVFTTRSGDCNIEYVNASSAAFNSMSGDLNIDRSFIDKLSFSTTSGDVEVYNTEANTFSGRTSSGDVKVSSLQCYGNSGIITSSGDVTLKNINAETLTSNSSSGSLKLSQSDIYVLSTSASSGDRKISNSRFHEIYSTSSSGSFIAESIASQFLNISSSSGKASIELIPVEDIGIDIVTSSGNVDLKLASDIAVYLECEKLAKNELRLNNASNNRITIRTNSGTVKLMK